MDTNGLVWSKVGSEIAIPILDYANMKPENNYETKYYLEKHSVHSVFSACPTEWDNLTWTRKIPVKVKNMHRKFWEMKAIKEK